MRNASPYIRKLYTQFGHPTVKDDLLCRWIHHSTSRSELLQVVIPKCLTPQVTQRIHGHLTSGDHGYSRTLHKATRSFYWPYMSVDIPDHCQQCPAVNCEDLLCLIPMLLWSPFHHQGPFRSLLQTCQSFSHPLKVIATYQLSWISTPSLSISTLYETKQLNLWHTVFWSSTCVSTESIRSCIRIRADSLNPT